MYHEERLSLSWCPIWCSASSPLIEDSLWLLCLLWYNTAPDMPLMNGIGSRGTPSPLVSVIRAENVHAKPCDIKLWGEFIMVLLMVWRGLIYMPYIQMNGEIVLLRNSFTLGLDFQLLEWVLNVSMDKIVCSFMIASGCGDQCGGGLPMGIVNP